ncbi:hypothetical protein AMTR_s00049p00158960 [Amborella trichopoda]|uniref:NB-ARC domain-containing protein n=1 Tax=Amborella trichopoda TaxID=13333 RepID=W1PZV9_AMBTC|nr:hypothetical protein AMTR_s00049p00158960 [Amborella trichopoda]
MLKSHSKSIHSNKCCRVRDLSLKRRPCAPEPFDRGLELDTLASMLLQEEKGRNGACVNFLVGEVTIRKTTLAKKAMKDQRKPPTVSRKQKELRKLLNGKKFLLILDDIQGFDTINFRKKEPCLDNFLNTVENGSRVLLTLRNPQKDGGSAGARIDEFETLP